MIAPRLKFDRAVFYKNRNELIKYESFTLASC